MKKELTAALAAAMMLACTLTACGESSTTPAQSSTPEASSAAAPESSAGQTAGKPSFVFKTADGVEIAVKAEADTIPVALGTPSQTFEAPSCAFSGTSYTYTYPGFTVETYPDSEGSAEYTVNRVYAVTLTDATVATPEGLKVGDSADDVRAKCGAPDRESPAFLQYTADGTDLSFFLEGGKVSSVSYSYHLG